VPVPPFPVPPPASLLAVALGLVGGAALTGGVARFPPLSTAAPGGVLIELPPEAGGGTVPEPPGALGVAVALPDAGAVVEVVDGVDDVEVVDVVLELLESPEPSPPPHAAASGARTIVKAAQATIDLR
jgi:hypothetical protein